MSKKITKKNYFKRRLKRTKTIISIICSIITILGLLFFPFFSNGNSIYTKYLHKTPFTISPESKKIFCGNSSRDFEVFLRNNEDIALYNIGFIAEGIPEEGDFEIVPIEDKTIISNELQFYLIGHRGNKRIYSLPGLRVLGPEQVMKFKVIYGNIPCGKNYLVRFYVDTYRKEPIESITCNYTPVNGKLPDTFPCS